MSDARHLATLGVAGTRRVGVVGRVAIKVIFLVVITVTNMHRRHAIGNTREANNVRHDVHSAVFAEAYRWQTCKARWTPWMPTGRWAFHIKPSATKE